MITGQWLNRGRGSAGVSGRTAAVFEYEYRPPGRTEYEYEKTGGGSREDA